MKIVELNFTDCKTWYDFYETIRIAFDFPEWYGRNWNAFCDLLRSECDADKVIIKGKNTLPKDYEKYSSMMHEILKDKIIFNKESNFKDFFRNSRSKIASYCEKSSRSLAII